MIKMVNKKIIAFLLAMCMGIVLMGCSQQTREAISQESISQASQEDAQQEEKTETVKDLSNTKAYIISKEILKYSGNTPESFVSHYDKETADFYQQAAADWYINDDGTVTLLCTPEQAEWQRNNVQKSLNELLENAKDYNSTTEINTSFTSEVFYFSPEISEVNIDMMIKMVTVICLMYQTFSDVPQNQISLYYKMVLQATGEVIGEGTLPKQPITLYGQAFPRNSFIG